LIERNFQKNATLDYWESGMDLGLSRDMFDSFVKYQRVLQTEFKHLEKEYKFEVLNGNRSVGAVQNDLRRKIARLLSIGAEPVAEDTAPPPPPAAPAPESV